MTLVLAGVAAWPADAAPAAGGALAIRTLSNRADLVSGGDALVEVVLPPGTDPREVRADLDGRDITQLLRPGRVAGLFRGVPARNSLTAVARPDALVGVVTGLAVGRNVLRATLPDGRGARLVITNHPASGPVFSGPQVQPWTCNPGTSGVGCAQPPRFSYYYVPAGTDPESVPAVIGGPGMPDPYFLAYDPANPPAATAIAQTTTDQGRTVPFVVRVERGSVDRGEYQISVLLEPGAPVSPWQSPAGWNHKLFLIGGPNCGISYVQGTAPSGLYGKQLGRGMAVMSTSLEVTGSNCNEVVQAESLVMAKEHLVETYGLVRFTYSIGGSGASIVQLWNANAYPGIYDGLVVEASFPDALTPLYKTNDCVTLLDYWTDPSRWAPAVTWTPADQRLVEGGDTPSGCAVWRAAFKGNFTPEDETGQVPAAQVYSATGNPGGVRSSLWDYSVSQLGRRPRTSWGPVERHLGRGFANNPLDTVGIQYGLDALIAGLLTPAQFADMNAKVGGHDIDYQPQTSRTTADAQALRVMYRSGYLNQANNLTLPIIDIRSAGSNAEIHDSYHSRSMRARLDRANRQHANQVIWQSPAGSGFVVDQQLDAEAFDLMDRWLTAIESNASGAPAARRVLANKPAAAVDRCTVTGTGVPGPCADIPSGSPRLAAGEPIVEDIAKCQLRPLRRADYTVTFTDAEWAQLTAAFPTGVCDYRLPGVGQQPTVAWLDYSHGPGGIALGAATASAPFGPWAASPKPGNGSPRGLAATGPSSALPLVGLLLLALGGRRHRSDLV